MNIEQNFKRFSKIREKTSTFTRFFHRKNHIYYHNSINAVFWKKMKKRKKRIRGTFGPVFFILNICIILLTSAVPTKRLPIQQYPPAAQMAMTYRV